jgi:hypothetical protein
MYSTQWVDFKTTLQVGAVSNFNSMSKDTTATTSSNTITSSSNSSMVMIGVLESRNDITAVAANPQARLVLEIQTK